MNYNNNNSNTGGANAANRNRHGSKDSLLRRFSRFVLEEGIVDEVKERMYYRSPSEIRKEKSKELLRRKRRNFRSPTQSRGPSQMNRSRG